MADLFDVGHLRHEYRFRRKDSTYCWVKDESHLVCNHEGDPIEVLAAWTDITARKSVGAALVAAENRQGYLLKSSPAVRRTDRPGHSAAVHHRSIVESPLANPAVLVPRPMVTPKVQPW